MSGLPAYILSVTAAGILCGIAVRILDEKNPNSRIVRLLAGILLAITVIKPLAKFEIGSVDDFWEELDGEGALAAQNGIQYAEEAAADIIKSRVEAYILDKSASLGATLRVEVMIENGTVPQITGVRLAGQVSPYARTRLTGILRDELGIAEEQQIWI